MVVVKKFLRLGQFFLVTVVPVVMVVATYAEAKVDKRKDAIIIKARGPRPIPYGGGRVGGSFITPSATAGMNGPAVNTNVPSAAPSEFDKMARAALAEANKPKTDSNSSKSDSPSNNSPKSDSKDNKAPSGSPSNPMGMMPPPSGKDKDKAPPQMPPDPKKADKGGDKQPPPPMDQNKDKDKPKDEPKKDGNPEPKASPPPPGGSGGDDDGKKPKKNKNPLKPPRKPGGHDDAQPRPPMIPTSKGDDDSRFDNPGLGEGMPSDPGKLSGYCSMNCNAQPDANPFDKLKDKGAPGEQDKQDKSLSLPKTDDLALVLGETDELSDASGVGGHEPIVCWIPRAGDINITPHSTTGKNTCETLKKLCEQVRDSGGDPDANAFQCKDKRNDNFLGRVEPDDLKNKDAGTPHLPGQTQEHPRANADKGSADTTEDGSGPDGNSAKSGSDGKSTEPSSDQHGKNDQGKNGSATGTSRSGAGSHN